MKKQLNKLAKSSALVIIALAAICTNGYAQEKEPTDSTVLLIQNPETNTVDTIYIIVDEMPNTQVAFEKSIIILGIRRNC